VYRGAPFRPNGYTIAPYSQRVLQPRKLWAGPWNVSTRFQDVFGALLLALLKRSLQEFC
jgi:hypothetical protein